MRLKEFIRPIEEIDFRSGGMGAKISQFSQDELPERSMLILGLSDFNGSTITADIVRSGFYNLAPTEFSSPIVDMGNIVSSSITDQYEIINTLCNELQNKDSLLVLLVGNNLMHSPALFAPLLSTRSIAIVDSHIDTNAIGLANSKENSPPVKQFYVGTQACYNYSAREASNSDIIRLGQFRDRKISAEPSFRFASMASISMNSVRYSDFPDSQSMNPNGFYAEEICQLAWFASNSNTQQLLFLTGYDLCHKNIPSANLLSQILWYIADGYCKRIIENPEKKLSGFKEYHIENNKLPDKLVFYQSVRTKKFWMRYGANPVIPCTKHEMDELLENNIPDQLWKKMHNS